MKGVIAYPIPVCRTYLRHCYEIIDVNVDVAEEGDSNARREACGDECVQFSGDYDRAGIIAGSRMCVRH